jgi:predicted regulator of Ras-like GTPase activity (Roadblock/LC7/MglB family)
MTANVNDLLSLTRTVPGVRGAMLATADGTIGATEHAHLQPGVAIDVGKTVRRLVVASTTANAPLRELLINFGPSRMMLRPVGEDVLVVLLDREASTPPLRTLLDVEIPRLLRLMRGEPENITIDLGDSDDEVGELLASPLGPVLREIESVYHNFRKHRGVTAQQTRDDMHEQLREWLLCCNPSNYTLPLLLDGLSETMIDDPKARAGFVGDVQGILRRAGALR